MLIKEKLIAESEARLKKGKVDVSKLDRELGDGPLKLSEEQKQRRMRQLLGETNDPVSARVGLERIINGNDLDNINYLAKGIAASHPVCRIQLKDSGGNLVGYASGFLIGPGVLMTNHHVFGSKEDARNSLADFDYELDVNGNERPVTHFAFRPDDLFYTNQELDYSVVAVAQKSADGARDISEWGWLPLNGEPGKGDPGEYLTIIQHPSGEVKQVCVRENKLLKYMEHMVWYATDTLGGSSGSPVFNRFWQVVALHHSGVPRKNSKGQTLTKDGKVWDASMDESLIDWEANEGIRISVIVADLNAALGNDPRVRQVLRGEAPPEVTAVAAAPSAKKSGYWIEQDGDSTSFVIPLRVPVDVVRQSAPALAPLIKTDDTKTAPVTSDDQLVEVVKIDQSTLSSRPGYQEDFIGKGNLSVPLPKIPASLSSKIATYKTAPSKSELKYFNYSVVMNKDRRLAFFSAVNIDGNLQQDIGKRTGDKWYFDPRIEEKHQIGNEFYKAQSVTEADRTKSPFDRGHLVRRLDATWGKTVDIAKEHGNDSFHFTNCSPQFYTYNESKHLWAGLEDYTRNILLNNKEKGIVMNGPVFDGPDAQQGKLPDMSAPSHKDPTFRGIKVPKYFWKILVTARSGKLTAAAFIMSQRDLIRKIDGMEEADIFQFSDAQIRVYQVAVSDLTKLTKLDFGKLAQADTHEATAAGPRLIESLDDIRVG